MNFGLILALPLAGANQWREFTDISRYLFEIIASFKYVTRLLTLLVAKQISIRVAAKMRIWLQDAREKLGKV